MTEEKIDTKVKNLESKMQEMQSDSIVKGYLNHGKRIIDLVNEKEYEEARFVKTAFLEMVVTDFWKVGVAKSMLEYINSIRELVCTLPIREGEKLDGGFYTD